MFSSRVPASLSPNQLAVRLAHKRAEGASVLDLTESNPTRVGIEYPAALLAPLADPAGLRYEAAARGLSVAREAIALDALRHGLDVDPARVVLTASTSEAYGFLFKLLCNPDDQVLVPRPSYPLFEHLSALDAVEPVPYALDPHGHWAIDIHSVARAITSRTRAILVVSPNNPTGSRLTGPELDALAGLCETHGLALVGDEVFAEYTLHASPAGAGADTGGAGARAAAAAASGLSPGASSGAASGVTPVAAPCAAPSVLSQQRVLTFALGGLSKSIGLPQLKLGWMLVGGPDAMVEAALERLDLIADTYLSVSTPVQLATPLLLERGKTVRSAIQARLDANLRALERAVARAPGCTLLPTSAGWTAVLRVPATQSEESLVLALLERDDVLISPGYFYDFPGEAYLIVSLLPDPLVFGEAIARVLARADVGQLRV